MNVLKFEHNRKKRNDGPMALVVGSINPNISSKHHNIRYLTLLSIVTLHKGPTNLMLLFWIGFAPKETKQHCKALFTLLG